ncbi:hypothetical protein E2F48_15480 [Arthrobacter crusticola]|uniref:Uncharacterized protein n=1 Tax=Arthrobacter crusticola TaxID=2547960 RepID=A0A4R5TSP2_9MICC|nr:hypothetical protein [Arthrobacter crusticola]TDK24164.1 hypothetical protein E2F48_15480 [Arthrobacter crusticola]
MTCVAGSVIIDAPTSVPVVGAVLWQAEIQTYNTATSQWEIRFRSPYYTNTADRVYVTAGPWTDANGDNTHYSIVAGISPGEGPVTIRVYNHFWRAEQGQWVYVDAGWFSTLDGTATGGHTCVLDNRGIVVRNP